MKMRTCISPTGTFTYGVHRPSYQVDNLRIAGQRAELGRLPDGNVIDNTANLPDGDVAVEKATSIFEIPNAFPFRGATFIDSSWADSRVGRIDKIAIPSAPDTSMSDTLKVWADSERVSAEGCDRLFAALPRPVCLALATTSTDPADLVRLAQKSCDFRFAEGSCTPEGLWFERDASGTPQPLIHDHDLFEAVANNPLLPDAFKEVMVLRPGIQGGSEIVGDLTADGGRTHIFEYLRRNSYIPWGHYAANFAHDAVRYRAADLNLEDMLGLRHLYYQRILVRLARDLEVGRKDNTMDSDNLEELRKRVLHALRKRPEAPTFTATLWGWNFGFDFAPSGYRLHASHQQVHQQNALIPDRMHNANGQAQEDTLPCFGCGDLVADAARQYREETGQGLFDDYLRCISSNRRMDASKGEAGLTVYEDDQVILFAPKSQTSQWELNLMPKGQVGNVLEADAPCRRSIDKAMLLAMRSLEGLGARLITCIEYPKRLTDPDTDQRLLYAFLPRLPWSPGAFSEAQLRFISGHYPEDFAAACRSVMPDPDGLAVGQPRP